MLAWETTGDLCGIALLHEGTLVEERCFQHSLHLSERMPGMLDEMLQAAGIRQGELTALAVDLGPGSFTGARIGVMTAKTFAFVLQIPVYGVNALEALAAEYTGIPNLEVAAILPCRGSTVYSAAYLVEGAEPQMLLEPYVREAADTAEWVENRSRAVLLCGNASAVLPCLSEGKRACGRAVHPSARMIATLAYQRRNKNPVGDDLFSLTPLYLAPPPITLPRTPLPVPQKEETS